MIVRKSGFEVESERPQAVVWVKLDYAGLNVVVVWWKERLDGLKAWWWLSPGLVGIHTLM